MKVKAVHIYLFFVNGFLFRKKCLYYGTYRLREFMSSLDVVKGVSRNGIDLHICSVGSDYSTQFM